MVGRYNDIMIKVLDPPYITTGTEMVGRYNNIMIKVLDPPYINTGTGMVGRYNDIMIKVRGSNSHHYRHRNGWSV